MNQVPYSKVEILYKRLFQAEKDGDEELQSILRRELNTLMEEDQKTESSVREQFVAHLKEKAKKTYTDLVDLLEGKLNEVDTAVEVSSLITQTILLSKRSTLEAVQDLDLTGQVAMLDGLLQGGVSVEDVQAYYKDLLQEAADVGDEEASSTSSSE